MAFQRKSSKHINDAQERAANLRGIDPTLDLGNDLTLAAFNAEIAAAQNLLDAYNAKLAKADAAGNEYEMAGGTRASEINYHPSVPVETPPADGVS